VIPVRNGNGSIRKLGRWAEIYLRNALQRGPSIGNVLVIGIPVILAELIFFYFGSNLRLDFANPTIFTMFAAHYTHQNIVHLIENIKQFIPLMIGVIILERRHKHIFYMICAVYFLAMPFTLSSIDLIFARYTGFTTSAGLSGINTALLGYFVYLLVNELYYFLINDEYEEVGAVPWFYVDKFIVTAFFMVLIVPILSIIQYAMFPQMNPVVHIGGYIIGFLIPPLVGMTGFKYWRAEAIIAIAAILTLPAIILLWF